MEEIIKNKILDYYNDCKKAHIGAAENNYKELALVNDGAMQAIKQMLYLQNVKIKGINE